MSKYFCNEEILHVDAKVIWRNDNNQTPGQFLFTDHCSVIRVSGSRRIHPNRFIDRSISLIKSPCSLAIIFGRLITCCSYSTVIARKNLLRLLNYFARSDTPNPGINIMKLKTDIETSFILHRKKAFIEKNWLCTIETILTMEARNFIFVTNSHTHMRRSTVDFQIFLCSILFPNVRVRSRYFCRKILFYWADAKCTPVRQWQRENATKTIEPLFFYRTNNW